MNNTPFFDAYEKYKKSKEIFNISIKKKYIQLDSGQKVLQDIDIFDDFGNQLFCIDY